MQTTILLFVTAIFDYIQQNTIEVFGAIFTILYVWLNAKENIWSWFFSILGTFCYVYLAFIAKLWGFCLLNIFFLVISVYGWWQWQKAEKIKNLPTQVHLPAQTQLVISYTNPLFIIQLLFIGAFFTLLFFYFLKQTNNASPLFDAFIFAFSMIAQFLAAKKKVESWLLWIVINLITVLMFWTLGYWVSVGLYTILFFLAMQGYLLWKEKLDN
jgi:nicotinamide mononucleotide transporter